MDRRLILLPRHRGPVALGAVLLIRRRERRRSRGGCARRVPVRRVHRGHDDLPQVRHGQPWTERKLQRLRGPLKG